MACRHNFSNPSARFCARSRSRTRSDAKRPVEIYLEVGDVDGYHAQLNKRGVKIVSLPNTEWWGDRVFKVIDLYGYQLWFYQTVAKPKAPQGAKIV